MDMCVMASDLCKNTPLLVPLVHFFVDIVNTSLYFASSKWTRQTSGIINFQSCISNISSICLNTFIQIKSRSQTIPTHFNNLSRNMEINHEHTQSSFMMSKATSYLRADFPLYLLNPKTVPMLIIL